VSTPSAPATIRPDPELLDLCDRLGFLVMDEALDELRLLKTNGSPAVTTRAPSRFGYAEMFTQCPSRTSRTWSAATAITRASSSWSIGNEIDYANDPFSDPVLGENYHPENPSAKNLVSCAQPLATAVRAWTPLGPSPPRSHRANVRCRGLPEVLDAAGYNYQENRYADDHRKYPHRIIYGSENSHQLGAWRAVQNE